MRKFISISILVVCLFSLLMFYFGYDKNKEINENFDITSRLIDVGNVFSDFGLRTKDSFNDLPSLKSFYELEFEWNFEDVKTDGLSFKTILKAGIKNIGNLFSLFFQPIAKTFNYIFRALVFSIRLLVNVFLLIINLIIIAINGGKALWV